MFESPALSKRQVQSRLMSQYLAVSDIKLNLLLPHPLNTSLQQARNQMLTSNQSHRLPQSSKASLQACKCKQAARCIANHSSDKRESTPSQPTCYQTSHTRSSIEKDSPLIPGEIDRLDPARLFRLSTTTRLPPVPPLTITTWYCRPTPPPSPSH